MRKEDIGTIQIRLRQKALLYSFAGIALSAAFFLPWNDASAFSLLDVMPGFAGAAAAVGMLQQLHKIIHSDSIEI